MVRERSGHSGRDVQHLYDGAHHGVPKRFGLHRDRIESIRQRNQQPGDANRTSHTSSRGQLGAQQRHSSV